MNDDKTILDIAQRAINDGRKEEARDLLRPLMKRKVIDAFILASKVANTQEQALDFLKHALVIDPSHVRVNQRLTELEKIYSEKDIKKIGELVNDSPTIIDERVKQTSKLFRKYGWTIVGKRKGYAQFMRKTTLYISTSFLFGLLFNVFGFIILLMVYNISEKKHAFIEADGDRINLSYPPKEVFITYPEQALVFLEETRSLSFPRALFFCTLGWVISSVVIVLIASQIL